MIWSKNNLSHPQNLLEIGQPWPFAWNKSSLFTKFETINPNRPPFDFPTFVFEENFNNNLGKNYSMGVPYSPLKESFALYFSSRIEWRKIFFNCMLEKTRSIEYSSILNLGDCCRPPYHYYMKLFNFLTKFINMHFQWCLEKKDLI